MNRCYVSLSRDYVRHVSAPLCAWALKLQERSTPSSSVVCLAGSVALGFLIASPGSVLRLLGCLTGGVLRLLGGTSGGVLCLAHRLTNGILYPLRRFPGLVGNLPDGV